MSREECGEDKISSIGDTYIESIDVSDIGRGREESTENAFEYDVVLAQKGNRNTIGVDVHGGELIPTLTSHDIDAYLEKSKTE